MDAKVQVPVEEYLQTSFEGPDPEYVDGEIVERALPDFLHGTLQSRFMEIFYEIRKRHPLYAVTEVRHKLRETRYRIPDVAVFAGDRPTERFPSTPPYIAIEILSPDDRFSEVIQKLDEYRTWGVPHIWLADPQLRRLLVYSATGLREVTEFHLPDYDVVITSQEVFE
jgi:Uma2 family endonuclease